MPGQVRARVQGQVRARVPEQGQVLARARVPEQGQVRVPVQGLHQWRPWD